MIIDHRGFCMPKLQVISTSENVPGDGSVSSSCRVTIGAQQSDARPSHARPKPTASQSAKSSEHLRPPNAPTISETQPMPNPKSIML
jgi:hypothetical protein